MVTIQEMVDHERRKNNLVMFNVPELKQDQMHDRGAEDKKAVKAILSDGVGVRGTQILKAIRFGGKRQNRNVKPWILLIQHESHKKKRWIFYHELGT